MKIRCPSCKSSYTLPRHKASEGRRVKCPKCGKVLVIKFKKKTGPASTGKTTATKSRTEPGPKDAETADLVDGFGAKGLDWDDEAAKETRIASLEDIFGSALTQPDEEAEAEWNLEGEGREDLGARRNARLPDEAAARPKGQDGSDEEKAEFEGAGSFLTGPGKGLEWDEEEKETVFSDFSDVFAPAEIRTSPEDGVNRERGDLNQGTDGRLDGGVQEDEASEMFDDETIMADVSQFMGELMQKDDGEVPGREYSGREAEPAGTLVGSDEEPGVAKEGGEAGKLASGRAVEKVQDELEAHPPNHGGNQVFGNELVLETKDDEEPLELARSESSELEPQMDSGDELIETKLEQALSSKTGTPASSVRETSENMSLVDDLMLAAKQVPWAAALAGAGLLAVVLGVVMLIESTGNRADDNVETEIGAESAAAIDGNVKGDSTARASHESVEGKPAYSENEPARKATKEKGGLETGGTSEAKKLLAKIFLNKSESAEESGRLVQARIYAAAALAQMDDDRTRARYRALARRNIPVLAYASARGVVCDEVHLAGPRPMLVCSSRAEVTAWNSQTGDEMFSIRAGPGWKFSHTTLSFSESLLVTACSDGKIRLYSLENGHDEGLIRVGDEPIIGLSDLVASSKGAVLFGAVRSGRVYTWSLLSRKATANRTLDESGANKVCVSAGGNVVAAAFADNTVVVMDSKGLFERGRIRIGRGRITALACADDATVAVGNDKGEVRVAEPGPTYMQKTIGKHKGSVTGLVFYGDTLVSTGLDSIAKFWNVDGNGCWKTIAIGVPVISMDASLERKHLAAYTTAGISLWDVDSGRKIAAVEGSGGKMNGLDVSSDGTYVAVACDDGTVRFYTTEGFGENKFMPGKSGVSFVTFSIGGHLLATGTNDSLDIWEFPSLNHVERLEWPARSAAFSPAGDAIAFCGLDGKLRLHYIGKGYTATLAKGIKNCEAGVSFGPNGTLIVTGYSKNKVMLFNLKAKRRVFHKVAGRILSLAFSPAGDVVAIGLDDGRVTRWSLERDTTLPALNLGTPVTALVFSGDGRKLAAGGTDGTVGVFEEPWSGRAVILPPTGARVGGLGLFRGGKMLAVSGWDGVVRIWDLTGGRRRAVMLDETPSKNVLEHEKRLSGMVLDGDRLVPDPGVSKGRLRLEVGAE